MDSNNQFIDTEPDIGDSLPYDYDSKLIGLGGWFSLVIIGQLLAIASGIYGIFRLFPLLDPLLNNSNELYSLIIFMLLAIVLIYILLPCAILYFIYKRNIIFRAIFIVRLIISFVITMSFYVFVETPVYSISFINDFISFALQISWVFYLSQSKRVKNTFIYSKTIKQEADYLSHL
jgi:hypothetical protein